MKLKIMAAAALTALMSGQAFALDALSFGFGSGRDDCPVTAGSTASMFLTDAELRELRAIEKNCAQLKRDSAESTSQSFFRQPYDVMKETIDIMSASRNDFQLSTSGLRPPEMTYEKTPSRFIRWIVIRDRSEGMPEECRYFYCDLKHYSGGRGEEPSNGWIVTFPRNKGKPDDCKKHYCNSVDTESKDGPLVNEVNEGIKIGYER